MKISPLTKFPVAKRMIIPVSISALVILFQLFSDAAFAQTAANPYPAVNVMSPNASSLGKYVDYPVNMHTGVPDIQIPLYTIQEGTLALPVSLSYHAAGLKVLELASSVGAGWSLNAGGVISRTVKGLPDEKIEYSGYSFFSHYGYSTYFMDEANKTDYRALLLGHKDGEPDIFFFNFAGYTGKFYFREDRTPVLLPESDLKIEPYFKPANTFSTYDYIQGFIITVPGGTRYYFGVTTDNTTDVDPIEKGVLYNADDQLAVWDQVISSWFLYKVESADGRYKIDLTYRAEKYGYHTIATAPCIPDCNRSISLFKTVVFGVALDQINSSNGRISFIPSQNLREDVCHYNTSIVESPNTEARALGEIKIESKVSSHCTSFKFSHDYFRSNGTLPAKIAFYGTFTSDKNRLKLNSIQEFQCNSPVGKPAHIFHYYDAGSVPRRLSFAQDHWGFNNGAEANTNLLPYLNANTGYGSTNPADYDNREAGWPQMRAGTLRSVQYPTGGGTEFVLEPNEVTTYQCKFEKQENAMYNVSAGMTSPDAGYGSPLTLTVTTPKMFYYRVTKVGSGSGSLYIDNTSIGSTNGVAEDYFFLNPGTYSVRAYANSDNGSGVGVLAFIHLTTSTCVEVPKMVGGLRVKRIDQFGIGSTAHLLKAYKYEKSYLYSVPVYIFKLRHELIAAGIVPNGTDEGCKQDGAFVKYHLSPVSTQPMQTTQGYHVGYGSVREIFPDGGYTVNEFQGALVLPAGWYTLEDVCVRKIDATKCLKSDPLFHALPLPHDFERGNLRSRTVYDKDNRKLIETTYDEEYADDAVGVFGVITKSFDGTSPTLPRHYDIRSARLLWKKKIDRVFNPANALEYMETQHTTEFSSAYHNLPTREIQTTSDGTAEKKYTYVPDLTACDYECPECATNYNAAAAALRVTYEDNVVNCGFGNGNCASFVGCDNNYNPCSVLRDCKVCAWTDYQYRLNELRKQYTTCIRNCKDNNTCLTDGKASPHAGISKVYLLEDKNQIADPVEVSVWKNSKLLKSTYFDFEIIDNNLSDIRLKRAYTTALESPATALTTVALGAEAPVIDPQYNDVPEVTYGYEAGRIAEQKGRDGVITSYLWGYGNTLPIVKAVGVDHNTLKTAYNTDPVNIRTHSAVANAQITTYEHDPVLGVIAITDAHGKKQTYDYDVLGRLLRIKDHEGKVVEQYEYRYQVQ